MIAQRLDEQRVRVGPRQGVLERLALRRRKVRPRPRRGIAVNGHEQRERHGGFFDRERRRARHAQAAARLRPDRRAVRDEHAQAACDRGDLARGGRVGLVVYATFAQHQRADRAGERRGEHLGAPDVRHGDEDAIPVVEIFDGPRARALGRPAGGRPAAAATVSLGLEERDLNGEVVRERRVRDHPLEESRDAGRVAAELVRKKLRRRLNELGRTDGVSERAPEAGVRAHDPAQGIICGEVHS